MNKLFRYQYLKLYTNSNIETRDYVENKCIKYMLYSFLSFFLD